MATQEITSENIQATIENNSIVILDFWASWCGPCKAFGPTFEAASEAHPDIVFGKVNTEVQRELATQLQIRSIPMIMIFRDQIQVFAQPGALPKPAFEDLIQQVSQLDMDEVRAKIAAQTAEA